jgi:hypothetical protein
VTEALEVLVAMAWLAFVALTVRDVRRRDREHVSALATLVLFSLARAIVWFVAVALVVLLGLSD